MNIIEAFIKFNKQLIIIISGLSGTNKTKIAQWMAKDFNLKYINIEKYIDETKIKENDKNPDNIDIIECEWK